MTPEEFRAAGHQLIDWLADYRSAIGDGPVRSVVSPGDVAGALSATPPTAPSEFADLLEMLDFAIVPGITQLQHPRNFGWFPANATLESVLGDMASSGLGTLGISWESCPALTEVEEVVVDWMRQLTGLSDQWRGSIYGDASSSCLVSLLVARERASAHSQTRSGLVGLEQPLVVYTSSQAHSSVRKAALLAGYGADHLRIVAHNANYDMDPADLARQMAADVKAGSIPAAVVATVGTHRLYGLRPDRRDRRGC